MNELILSAFMTFISGKQDVPLNSECSVVLEKEKLSGTKELSQNGNTVVVMNKNVPKICKVTSISWMEPLKIDILYSECPAKI